MAYDANNPKRVSSTWDHYWTKVSDLERVRDNQAAVYADFDTGHDTTTGKHATDDIGDWVSGWVDTAYSNVSLTNSVDDVVEQAAVTGLSDRVDPELCVPSGSDWTSVPQLSSDIWGGIASCKGATAGGGEAEAALQSVATAARHRIIRRAAGSGTSNFTPLTVGTGKVGFRLGRFVGIAGKSEQAEVVQRNQIVAVGAPVAKNHIDRPFQNCAAIKAALDARHDAGFLAEAITLEEMYGGAFVSAGTLAITRSNQFTTASLGAHGGNMMCIVPWKCSLSAGGGEHCFLPGWDDTNMYIVVWIAPGMSAVGSDKAYCGGTAFRLDVPATPSWSGSFDGAFSVAQADATDLDIYQSKLGLNDEILDKLWLARHRGYSGLHAIGVDEFTGYTVVKNNTTHTISGTIGVATAVTLEAWPGTNPIYLCALKGAAGSGIAALTIGGDETNAKVYIRRVTAGTSNDFTLRVIRIDRV